MQIRKGVLLASMLAIIVVGFLSGLGASFVYLRPTTQTQIQIQTTQETLTEIVPVKTTRTITTGANNSAHTITQEIVGDEIAVIAVRIGNGCTVVIPTVGITATNVSTVYVFDTQVSGYFNATIVTITAYYTTTSTTTIYGSVTLQTVTISSSNTTYTTTECPTYI